MRPLVVERALLAIRSQLWPRDQACIAFGCNELLPQSSQHAATTTTRYIHKQALITTPQNWFTGCCRNTLCTANDWLAHIAAERRRLCKYAAILQEVGASRSKYHSVHASLNQPPAQIHYVSGLVPKQAHMTRKSKAGMTLRPRCKVITTSRIEFCNSATRSLSHQLTKSEL